MKEIRDKILDTLKSLEEDGEIIITSTMPHKIADTVFHATLETWFQEKVLEDEPMECTMPYLLEQTTLQLMRRFSCSDSHAKEIINSYYNSWLNTRSIKEVAEIYWHETPYEMAGRAYYHIELGEPDIRDLDYLEWRKHH